MTNRLHKLLIVVAATFATALWFPVTGVRGQMSVRASRYAVTGARIVTAAGPAIDKGTIVMSDGRIEDVGAAVTAPADAVVIDGAGLTVYPGLVDMSDTSIVAAASSGGATPGTGRAGTGGTTTWADQERENRAAMLHPDANAAAAVQYEGDALRRLAAAGITSVLAVPPQGLIRGQSALVNVTAPPDPSAVSIVGSYRRGAVVVRSAVAQHITLAAGRGGAAYPGSLLGVISFVRQSFYDAQWQKDARAFADRHKDASLDGFEPALDALAPALDRRMPVAFEASEEREILRALGLAKEFNLDPIIVGGLEASNVIDDLKAAKARVIVSVNFAQDTGGGAEGRGAGGGPAETAMRVLRMRQNGPKVPAALDKAGIAFAFTRGGVQNPTDFIRNVGRVVRDGGLSEDAAIKALTTNAAKMAGAGDRLGTIEKGKLANLIAVEGNLFDSPRIRHVFVAGWPIDIDVPAPTGGGGRGRGGQQRFQR
jgi:imidazolonepropionase-like amidohydrolase